MIRRLTGSTIQPAPTRETARPVIPQVQAAGRRAAQGWRVFRGPEPQRLWFDAAALQLRVLTTPT